MALQKDLGDNKWGVDLSAAYIRFKKQPAVDYGSGVVVLEFEVFVDAAAAASGKAALPGIALKTPRVVRSFSFANDTPLGIVAAAYSAVKADGDLWPELHGATDV